MSLAASECPARLASMNLNRQFRNSEIQTGPRKAALRTRSHQAFPTRCGRGWLIAMTPLCSRSDLSLHLRSAEPFVEAASSRRPSFGLGAVATCPRCENAAAMLGRLYGRARVKICPTRVVQRRDSCLNVQPVHLSCWIASAGRGAGR